MRKLVVNHGYKIRSTSEGRDRLAGEVFFEDDKVAAVLVATGRAKHAPDDKKTFEPVKPAPAPAEPQEPDRVVENVETPAQEITEHSEPDQQAESAPDSTVADIMTTHAQPDMTTPIERPTFPRRGRPPGSTNAAREAAAAQNQTEGQE